MSGQLNKDGEWKDYNEGELVNSIEFTLPVPPTSITFGNGSSLSWASGKLECKGEIEESAKLFFEFLKPYVDEYIRCQIKQGENK